jgi:chemotaxis protein MotA
MNIIFGIILVFGSVLGGYTAMGGHLDVLWQPWEAVIIIGAALGAFLISNSKSVVKDTVSVIAQMARGKPHSKEEYLELFALLYTVFRLGKENLQKLETDFDDPEKSAFFANFKLVSKNKKNVRFLADYLRLVLLENQKPHELESLLDTELDSIEQELQRVPNGLMVMADSLPALGIVAAVLGVIKAMGAIGADTAYLGMLIGGALVGTFLGVLLSYGLVGPLANAIKARREQELVFYVSIKTSLIAFLNNYKPQICVEYGRKTIGSEVRPEFEEVEKIVREVIRKSGLTSN